MAATARYPAGLSRTAVFGYLVTAVAILVAAFGVLSLRTTGGAPPTEDAITIRSSSTALMIVEGGRNTVQTSALEPITRETVAAPVLTMVWTVYTPDGVVANVSDPVATLRVELVLRNDTTGTVIVGEDVIRLSIARDGEAVGVPAAPSPRTELAPGETAEALYEVPVHADGTYEWHAEAAYVPNS